MSCFIRIWFWGAERYSASPSVYLLMSLLAFDDLREFDEKARDHAQAFRKGPSAI